MTTPNTIFVTLAAFWIQGVSTVFANTASFNESLTRFDCTNTFESKTSSLPIENPRQNFVPQLQESAIRHSVEYHNGSQFQVVECRGQTIALCLNSKSKYVRVDLIVRNNSAQAFDVLPSNFALVRIDSPDNLISPIDMDYKANSDCRKAKTLAFIHGGNYRQGIGYQAPLAARSYTSGYINGYSNAGYANANYSGYTTTTFGPRRGLLGLVAQAAASSSEHSYAASQTMLRANTVKPGEEIAGSIYFPKQPKHSSLAVRVTIDGKSFDIADTGSISTSSISVDAKTR